MPMSLRLFNCPKTRLSNFSWFSKYFLVFFFLPSRGSSTGVIIIVCWLLSKWGKSLDFLHVLYCFHLFLVCSTARYWFASHLGDLLFAFCEFRCLYDFPLCEHICQKKCHPFHGGHQHCHYPCGETLDCGHQCAYKCKNKPCPPCKTIVSKRLKCNHVIPVSFFADFRFRLSVFASRLLITSSLPLLNRPLLRESEPDCHCNAHRSTCHFIMCNTSSWHR